MIRGKINAELEAAVPIEVLGTRGIVRSVVAVIDTGFTGLEE